MVAGAPRRGPNVPSTPAARRLRARLRARDLDARAAGRIVWASVGDGDDPAAGIYRAARWTRRSCSPSAVRASRGSSRCWTTRRSSSSPGRPDDPLAALALDALDARGLPAAVVLAPAGLGAVLARAGLAGRRRGRRRCRRDGGCGMTRRVSEDRGQAMLLLLGGLTDRARRRSGARLGRGGRRGARRPAARRGPRRARDGARARRPAAACARVADRRRATWHPAPTSRWRAPSARAPPRATARAASS